MTALLADPLDTLFLQLDLRGSDGGSAERPGCGSADEKARFGPGDGRSASIGRSAAPAPTLDALVSGLWRELRRLDTVRCPVCGDEAMRAQHASGGPLARAACGSCASVLS